MGTQTQGQNREQQGGNDKKTPAPHQQPPHDPIVDPDRDDANRAERVADKNRRKGGEADDSTEQPGKGELVNEDEDDDEDDDEEEEEEEGAEVGKR